MPRKRLVTAAFISAFLILALAVTELPNLAEADPIPAPPINQIYIRSDGTVEPSTAPIQRKGNVYTFRSDLTNQPSKSNATTS